MKPDEFEPLCLISYEIARILLAGGPDTRPGFWKAYRNEQELNLKTNYRNYHIHVCRGPLAELGDKLLAKNAYFRNDKIVYETEAPVPPVTPIPV
jgi:hypothetical protein